MTRRFIIISFELVISLFVLAQSIGCLPTQPPTNPGSPNISKASPPQSDNTNSSNSSTIDLRITDKNRSILDGFETEKAYDPVSDSPTSYRKLIWDYGQTLDVTNKRPDGKYTQLNDNPGNGWWGECVFAVQSLSRSNVLAGGKNWIRGKRVMDRGVNPGTVIATFIANNGLEFDPSGNSHTAVFKAYTANGFEVWDQNWDGKNKPEYGGHGVVGTHYIYATGSGKENANNYYVVQIANPGVPTGTTNITNEFLTPSSNVQYNREFTGSIAKLGDYQDWKFTGKVGEIITIHVVQDGGASLDPQVYLLDTSGKAVSDGGYNGEAWIKNYTLLFAGTYTIRIKGNYSTIGGYKISLTLKSLPVTVVYGQEGKGNIAFINDYQDWKFAGKVGEIITIHVVQDGGASLDPQVYLLDTSGKAVSDGGYNGEAWIKNYTLLFAGTYAIRIKGNYSTIGGYKISLTLKSLPVTVVYGQEGKGNIAFINDYQDWKFTGKVGEIITIHVVQDGGASLDPQVYLLDTSGKAVSDGGYNGEAWIKNYTLLFAGTYTIRIKGNYSTIGGYRLSMNKN